MIDPRDLELNLYIFILAGFLGYRIISRVPPLLHTPLMSATNALSGISLIGSMVVAGRTESTLGTLFHKDITSGGYLWITIGMVIGGGFGASLGLTIPMTAVPQRTAFSHSLGALAATMIGIAEYVLHLDPAHKEGLSGLFMTPL